MNNRNPIKQWFVTFPQTEVSKADFVSTFPPSDYYIIAQEEHKDGGLHLHLGIKLKKKLCKKKLIKWISEKWPNDCLRIHMEPIRKWEWVNDYCMKEDPNYIIAGSLSKKKRYTVEEALSDVMNDVKIDCEEGKELKRGKREAEEHRERNTFIDKEVKRWIESDVKNWFLPNTEAAKQSAYLDYRNQLISEMS